jgi:hypothetical protein
MVDQAARKRIEALEEQGVQRDREIADLSGRVSRLAATLEAIRVEAPGVGAPEPHPPPSAVSSAAASRSPASASTSPPAAALPPSPAGFTSLIIADFPALFAKGKKKAFGRGTPGGLFAEFRRKHLRCCGVAAATASAGATFTTAATATRTP